MTKRDLFFLRCHEVAEFCLARAGRCFGGWSREKVFEHIVKNALEDTLVVVKDGDEVKCVAIYKPTGQGRIFFGQLIGTREACRRGFARIIKRWPHSFRFFAYRQHGSGIKLVEFNLRSVLRFCGERIEA